MLLFNSFAGVIPEKDKNGCFCEKSSQKRKGKGKAKAPPSKGGVPPVMFVSTLLRIVSTLILLIRRKLGLIRKRVS